MAGTTVEVKIRDITKTITLDCKICGLPSAMIRWKICAWLMMLAAWVGGFEGIEFNIDENKEENNEK